MVNFFDTMHKCAHERMDWIMTYTEYQIVAETAKVHVNNVKLLEFLDDARNIWYRYCILNGVEGVVVHIGANYKREVLHGNKLFIRTGLERVGNTSFTLKQTMVNHLDELVVTAEIVLTTINRQTRQKTPVPDAVRKLLDSDSILELNDFTQRFNAKI